uniref:Immunoglobulin V-set domain-containing protein n=1 Tax=Dicentrarchus labrax TaxID=13489 RepID=A0A8P4KQJ0_DICLA
MNSLDGNTLVNAQTIVYTGTGGGAVKVKCFSYYGGRKFFCKEGCNQEDILIQTTGVTAHNGRYSMTYDGTFTGGNVFVTITQLTKSDSGLYWCGSGAQYQLIEIIIVDGEFLFKVIKMFFLILLLNFFYQRVLFKIKMFSLSSSHSFHLTQDSTGVVWTDLSYQTLTRSLGSLSQMVSFHLKWIENE